MESSKPRKRKLKIRRDSESKFFTRKKSEKAPKSTRYSESAIRKRKRGSSALPTKCKNKILMSFNSLIFSFY